MSTSEHDTHRREDSDKESAAPACVATATGILALEVVSDKTLKCKTAHVGAKAAKDAIGEERKKDVVSAQKKLDEKALQAQAQKDKKK
jgi:hypothetical protein